MKATINGIEVNGTPEEIAELIELQGEGELVNIDYTNNVTVGSEVRDKIVEGQEIAFNGFSNINNGATFTIKKIYPEAFDSYRLELEKKLEVPEPSIEWHDHRWFK